jgi:putative ABC transport system substrate-binding protein
MRRRELIGYLGGAAAMPFIAPLGAFAQDTPEPPSDQPSAPPAESPPQQVPLPPEPARRIGVLMNASRRDREAAARLEALTDGLKAKGWTESGKLRIDVRWSDDEERRIRRSAADLVELAPEVIVASDSETAKALQAAGGGIPVVFVNVVDPVGAGLVAALDRPGGNITGIRQSEFGASTQWPELLKRIAPNVMRVAILHDPEARKNESQIAALQTVTPAVGMEAFGVDAKNFRELERAIAGFSRSPNGGLIIGMPGLSSRERTVIVRLAARFKLPAIYSDRLFVTAGGLISHGPDLKGQYRLAADYVDRILKGEKPADLPVQAPAKFSTVINLKTAKALGLTVPPGLRELADKVID